MCFRPMMPILVLAVLATTQFHAPARSISFENSRDVAQQQDGSLSKGSAGCSVEMQTDAEGVEFNDYLRDL
jgi:hypothetical protein